MGKDRKKGEKSAKTASSSDFGDLATTGFIGFSGNVIEGLDPEFQLVFKALNKKDSVTKLKALQDFQNLLPKLDENGVSGVMAKWASAYQRLGRDIDWKVRESANQTFTELIKVVKKGLAPQLKAIFGTWLCDLFDPYREVANAAKNAMMTAFQDKKQIEAVQFCSKEVTNFVKDSFEENSQAPGKNADATFREHYERVISTSILALSYVIETIPDVDNAKLSQNYEEIFNQKLWSYFSVKDYPFIRKGCYHLATTLCKKLPEFVERNIEKFSSILLFSALGESEFVPQQDMWEAVLTFAEKFPAGWKHVNNRKQTFPKIWELLRNAGYRSNISLENLLQFISIMPTEVMGDGPEFAKELFTNMWEGFKKEIASKVHSVAVLRSYGDFLKYFVALNRKNNGKNELVYLKENYFFFLEYFLTTDPLSSTVQEILPIVSETFVKITYNNCPSEVLGEFWSRLESLTNTVINWESLGDSDKKLSHATAPNVEIYCSRLASFIGDVHTRYQAVNADAKATSLLLENAKKLFIASFPNAKSQSGAKSFLVLLIEISKNFGLFNILNGSPITYDLFFRNQLLHWTSDWLSNFNDNNVKMLFRFAYYYFNDKSKSRTAQDLREVSHDWDTFLLLAVKPVEAGDQTNFLEGFFSLSKEFKLAEVTENVDVWTNNGLDETLLSITNKLTSTEKESEKEISLQQSILSYMLSGASKLLKETTHQSALTTLKNFLSKFLEEADETPIEKISQWEQNAIAIMECIISLFTSSAPTTPLTQYHYELLALIFNARIYSRPSEFSPEELEEETPEGHGESSTETRLRLLARSAWKQIVDKFKSQLSTDTNSFWNLLVNQLHKNVRGKFSIASLHRLSLLGEQANVLFESICSSLPVAKQQSALDSMLLERKEWSTKHHELSLKFPLDHLKKGMVHETS